MFDEGRDRPRLEQMEPVTNHAPLDILGIAQFLLQAACELVELPRSAFQRRRAVVAPVGSLQGEGEGLSLARDQLLTKPIDKVPSHFGAATADWIRREQHARNVRPHQPLYDNRHFVSRVYPSCLTIDLHPLAVPRVAHSEDRGPDGLIGVQIQHRLEFTSKRGPGRIFAERRGADGKGGHAILDLAHLCQVRLDR